MDDEYTNLDDENWLYIICVSLIDIIPFFILSYVLMMLDYVIVV